MTLPDPRAAHERPRAPRPRARAARRAGARSSCCTAAAPTSTTCSGCFDILDPGRRLRGITVGGPLSLPPGGKHWYAVARVGYPDPETFHATYAALRSCSTTSSALDWGRTVLGGFSQGTVMSYALGLGAGRPVPAGILALSGFIPTVEGWAPDLVWRRDMPVLIAHGSADPVISVDFARAARGRARGGQPAGASTTRRRWPTRSTRGSCPTCSAGWPSGPGPALRRRRRSPRGSLGPDLGHERGADGVHARRRSVATAASVRSSKAPSAASCSSSPAEVASGSAPTARQPPRSLWAAARSRGAVARRRPRRGRRTGGRASCRGRRARARGGPRGRSPRPSRRSARGRSRAARRRWPAEAPGARDRRVRDRVAEPAGQRRVEVLRAQRLGQVVVHARGEAALAVALHRVGRHRDDRQRGGPRLLAAADLARGRVAVELGHLAVHEHERVASLGDARRAPAAVLGDLRREAAALEQRARHGAG